jgi:DNA repair protein RecO (recombination protein O)
VLHATPWRETSLVLDVLSRDHGRVALVARGAKRPTSQFRGLLGPFGSLALSWTGRGEVQTLVRVEWLGGLAPLRGDGLLAGFYVNELVVRLLARGDPHPRLFASYVGALADLAAARGALDAVLRGFELDLLREAGHAPAFDVSCDGAPIRTEARYRIDQERGVYEVAAAVPGGERAEGESVEGRVLQALSRRDFSDAALRGVARDVLRRLIRYHLQGRPLNTRRILQDLRQLQT